ncbi:MAG: hypothetical protein ACK5RT_15675 [Dolichospermum sp.]
MLVVSCQLLVGAKHLEDKLSVIAKNSSPNASPVQLSVVSCPENKPKEQIICAVISGVEEKSNEITAIPELIKVLDLTGCLYSTRLNYLI